MKNTTLGRQPSNTMKKNQGTSSESKRSDQSDDNRSFAFNGQMGNGVNRDNSRDGICVNPYTHLVKNPDRINLGLDTVNRRGNGSDSSHDRRESMGPSVTRDAPMKTIARASEGRNVGKETTATRFKNPDAINVGMK